MRRLIPALALAALLLGPATAAADPQTATIAINGQGTLVGGGVGATLDLHYMCEPPISGAIGVTINQIGQGGGFGAGSTTAVCDGQVHQTTIFVPAFVFVFIAGPATATAVVNNNVFVAETTVAIKLQ